MFVNADLAHGLPQLLKTLHCQRIQNRIFTWKIAVDRCGADAKVFGNAPDRHLARPELHQLLEASHQYLR